ncbi:MAG: Rpn family recombination-promoting nuclease/putative transposase [Myxococcales bacterium]|nr:Rpn family recombination-promoting nuclease/putative transposase [Myxococcales bacterium]
MSEDDRKDPHDRLVRHTLSIPENVEGVLRATLPSSTVTRMDWSTLQMEPGTFVDRAGESRTDLLFSVQMGKRPALVYVLLEHQSTPAPDMPLRMLVYMTRIWRARWQTHGPPLPIIVPVVLHHGALGWTKPRRLAELLDCDDEMRASLSESVPDFELLIDDLTRVPEAELLARPGTPIGRLVVWVLRAARAGHDPGLVDRWAEELNEAEAAGSREALLHVVEYLVSLEEGAALFEALLRAPLSNEVQEGVMGTYQQKWFEEGEAKGRAEGEAKGRAEVLLKQLRLRFSELPVDVEKRVRAASIEELDRWVERVLSAESIADVLR